ncbi:hypothetical protein SDC9_113159 [bioreactor metagenome]|uniref:Uncharacterized protein n=1 Tax=bioreactor metagenome TaxID=1076179 RepID=A0A645BM46_9ZZZZ
MLRAVLFPMPLGPSMPVTSPFLGTGSLYRRNMFSPYWCTISPTSSSARPIILIASNWHLLAHIPHPEQRVSEIIGLPLSPSVITSTPVLTMGQNLMHSRLHFLFWQRSCMTEAIRMATTIMESDIRFLGVVCSRLN